MPTLQWAVVNADLDPVVGSEQSGRRPVLVVNIEEFNQAIPNLTILPLTSTRRRLYPSEVALPKGGAGLPLDPIILAHQIRTISTRRLRRTIGYLEDPALRVSVREAIKEHLDLN
jgi:mRNA interferase MazF